MLQLPKSCLISLIMQFGDIDEIRRFFSIHIDINLTNRLNSFSKARLIDFITTKGGRLEAEARAMIESFPIKSSPTLYIIIINKDINVVNVQSLASGLANSGRENAMLFHPTSAIRAIYMTDNIRLIDQVNSVYEISLRYEKLIEITECDTSADDYMEIKKIPTLENAIFWFSNNPQMHHGIIACNDFSAVKPCMNYLAKRLNFHVSQPELTQAMLEDISSGGKIRNATFKATHKAKQSDIDVHTITLYDDDLASTNTFANIHKTREQRSGFYVNHPSMLRAGIGITRNYGRIWTPAHLNRNELLNLSLRVITKLESKLAMLSGKDAREHISYFGNIEVCLNSKTLKGKARKLIEELLIKIVEANKEPDGSINLPHDQLIDLIEFRKDLSLFGHFVFECPNCMETHAVCPTCNSMLDIGKVEEETAMLCPKCKAYIDSDTYTCTCGGQIPIIDLNSKIVLTPETDLLDALKNFSQSIHPSTMIPDFFLITGGNLVTLNGNDKPNCREIKLEDLEFWRSRAHIHQVTSDQDMRILRKMREKCKSTNYHPKSSDCRVCFNQQFTVDDLKNARICLLRAFGLPINMKFDGIHCGSEKADIIYTDRLDGDDVEIGIHVKSYYNSNPPRGLGRGLSPIKGLYAQTYYSLYKVLKGSEQYDILGIAIPNRISQDVKDSIKSVLFRFGISFLVVDEECWKKIMQINYDNAHFIQ